MLRYIENSEWIDKIQRFKKRREAKMITIKIKTCWLRNILNENYFLPKDNKRIRGRRRRRIGILTKLVSEKLQANKGR